MLGFPRTAAVLVGASICALAFASLAAPAPSIVINGSFESPGGDVRQRISESDIPGWTYKPGLNGTSYEIYESDNHDGLRAADGNHYVSFGHNGTSGGSLSQRFDTTPGVTYRVTYYVAEQQGDDPRQVMRAVLVNGDETLTRDNSPLKPRFLPGKPIVFTAKGAHATLTFIDATPADDGGYPNLALDGVRVTVAPAGHCAKHARC